MRLLMFPFRFVAAVVAWAIGSAIVIVIEAGLTRGHAPVAVAIGAPLLALSLGAIAGTVVWRMSRSHPVQAAGVLAVLVAVFAMAAVLGGAAVRG
jgi:hypothetical protein